MRALELPDTSYQQLAAGYAARRTVLCDALRAAGFRIFVPEGASYVLADVSDFGRDDVEFCQWLVRDIGVAAVPGSSLDRHPELGRHLVRSAFGKREAPLHAAAQRLAQIRARA